MDEKERRQEMIWLEEEINQDESLRDTSDFSNFHQERIDENRMKLKELKEIEALDGNEI